MKVKRRTLRNAFAYLPDLRFEDFQKAKKIWEPSAADESTKGTFSMKTANKTSSFEHRSETRKKHKRASGKKSAPRPKSLFGIYSDMPDLTLEEINEITSWKLKDLPE